MKELTDIEVERNLIKSRIKQIGNNLSELSNISSDIPNVDIEMICVLGAYIKIIEIQIDRLKLIELCLKQEIS